ncbi:MAG TPA: hypothetical protein VGL78_16175 [Solirubrobacteraceae bacterium]|jgi:hypothetical protein
MEILLVLRAVWPRRRLLAGGLVCSVVVFVALGGATRATTSSVGSTSVTIDTPRSQLVTVAPAGAASLQWRAPLLEHLMATGASTKQLAHRIGVSPDKVLVVDSDLSVPLVATSMAQAAGKAASEALAPYTLTVFLQNTSLPVISIEADAPARAGAKRLANAAVGVLRSEASPPGTFSSTVETNAGHLARQPFVVTQISPVRMKALTSTSLALKHIAAALFVFAAWCIAATLVARRMRRLRLGRRALPA